MSDDQPSSRKSSTARLDMMRPGWGFTNDDSARRCVWLAEEDCVTPELYEKWFAAPADPAEAVKDAIGTILRERPYCAPEHVVEAVLRALGAPHVR